LDGVVVGWWGKKMYSDQRRRLRWIIGRAAGRPKSLEVIAELEALLEVRG
jgi:hypothetical protein